MKLHIRDIPQEIIDQCQSMDKAHDQHVHIRINGGMHGSPQAGALANQQLVRRLAKHGYHKTPHTPGLWKHTWCPITFALVVDDFGIKHVVKEHAQHLLQALQEHCEVSVDWEG